MARWDLYAGWMKFPYLDQANNLASIFTLGYRLTDNPDEMWTSRFNRFKNGNDNAAIYGAAYLLKATLPSLIKTLQVDPADSVFVSALSSGETTLTITRPFAKIISHCARKQGINFASDCLTKNQHIPIHNVANAARRDEVLSGANYQATALKFRHIFVFDDLVTRGATLSSIARAIYETTPGATIYGVALAKTERVSYCPNANNNHLDNNYNKEWEIGEQESRKKASKGTNTP